MTATTQPAAPTPAPGSAPAPAQQGSVKETIVSLIISFVMALVFRSYVVEAFIIPTGSMAPTLLGAHMRFQSPESGWQWTVNPWYDIGPDTPSPVQGGGPWGAPTATDPMSTSQLNPIHQGGRPSGQQGYVTPPEPKPLLQGDRILVQKYLYELFPPKRWDVVVFKNPEESSINFIKRLVGLPCEEIWIAGGDIFARPIKPDRAPDGSAQPDGPWRVQRKPAPVQSSLWRPIFWSQFAPLQPERDGRRWFVGPWRGEQWQTGDRREYRSDTAAPTTLEWDSARWPIWDWVPYNEMPQRLGGSATRGFEQFPVSDVRMSAGVRPDAPGLKAIASVKARGHEMQGVIDGGRAIVRMRPITDGSPDPAWTELASAPAPGFAPGRATNVEFWHVDQSLQLWIDGRLIVEGLYEWSPSERLLHATGAASDAYASPSLSPNPLRSAATYAPDRPSVSWSFEGSPLTLSRVGLDRDLYYESVDASRSGPALATHPNLPAILGPEQYFVLGDNSPSSKDGRLWDRVDPWVSDQIDATVGVVPRKLLLGKAFFVYFPSPFTLGGRIPVPDFGRMRFIR